MGNLAKIREISVKYNISARTLRYYEDTGLIESTRSDGYAYRLYDEVQCLLLFRTTTLYLLRFQSSAF